MAGDSINIIYPPPELKNIIDKTASFIARNGPEFAIRIQQAEPNNDKFNFLKPDDPFNSYYQLKVTEFRERAINGNTIPGANRGEREEVGSVSLIISLIFSLEL